MWPYLVSVGRFSCRTRSTEPVDRPIDLPWGRLRQRSRRGHGDGRAPPGAQANGVEVPDHDLEVLSIKPGDVAGASAPSVPGAMTTSAPPLTVLGPGPTLPGHATRTRALIALRGNQLRGNHIAPGTVRWPYPTTKSRDVNVGSSATGPIHSNPSNEREALFTATDL